MRPTHRSFGYSLWITLFVGSAVGCGSQQQLTSGAQNLLPYLAPQPPGTGTVDISYPPCGTSSGMSCDATSAGGRMTGGGFLLAPDALRVTHGFELRCDAQDERQNLEVNWDGGHHFSLETVTAAQCINDVTINEGQPRAGFDIFVGTGTGRLDGQDGAKIRFAFSDAGEPGRNDAGALIINDSAGKKVLSVSSALAGGNYQAHRATGL